MYFSFFNALYVCNFYIFNFDMIVLGVICGCEILDNKILVVICFREETIH